MNKDEIPISDFLYKQVMNAIRKDGNIEETIGCGSSGFVYKIRDPITGEVYAEKMIANYSNLDQPKNEVQIIYRLNHRHLIKFFSHRIFGNKKQSMFLIKMEYCAGGTLSNLIKDFSFRMPESTCRLITKMVLTAIQYIHSVPAVHRDIKPDNIFLRRPINKEDPDRGLDVVLGDFGLAKELKNEKRTTSTTCGTVSYLAPEILHNINKCESERTEYSAGVDIWSLGVTVFELLYGFRPFDQDKSEPSNIINKINVFENNPDIIFQHIPESERNPQHIDFLLSCLRVKTEERATADELLAKSWMIETRLPEEEEFEANLLFENDFSYDFDSQFV